MFNFHDKTGVPRLPLVTRRLMLSVTER